MVSVPARKDAVRIGGLEFTATDDGKFLRVKAELPDDALMEVGSRPTVPHLMQAAGVDRTQLADELSRLAGSDIPTEQKRTAALGVSLLAAMSKHDAGESRTRDERHLLSHSVALPESARVLSEIDDLIRDPKIGN
ncbi:Uncharacterised protein [uncultured archaeon]|nr:Uncharacterised protein [uncultured archaeon]